MNIEDPQVWIRIEPYLDQVLDLAPDARDAWLGALDPAEPEIAQEIRRLLAERDVLEASGFLDTPFEQAKLARTLLGLLLK